MSQSMPISAADAIAAYIEAKDLTHLQSLRRAFVEDDCEIEIMTDRRSAAIFPRWPAADDRHFRRSYDGAS